MKEVWKDIPGYEGIYKVSDLGRIKSFKRYRGTNENILRPQKLQGGYLIIALSKNGQKIMLIHQLVAMAFLDHKPNGHTLVVNHKNFNRADNRLENLEVITHRENTSLRNRKYTSKYVGVSWNKALNKWNAKIYINKELKHLGYFIDEKEASEAYENKLRTII